jgi:uncharacterized membrane protein (DUF373 family)
MKFKEELAAGRAGWKLLTLYQKFEHAVILLLTALIAVVVALAVWNLALKVGISIMSSGFDPTDYEVFQAFFGMIFTVIIALEFKRSLLVVAERRHGVVQVRTVVLIALLAVVRKLMIIDLSTTDAQQLLALSRRSWRWAAYIGSSGTRTDATTPRQFKTLHPRQEVLLMTIHKLEKAEWRPFLDLVSKVLPAKQAEIEVASLKLGDQVEAEWLPLLGLAYDPNDDIVEVALDGLDHMIPRPRELYIDNGIGSLSSLEIIDADGVKQIVKLRDPLMLPPPRT